MKTFIYLFIFIFVLIATIQTSAIEQASGDASATNQTTEITRLTSIRDRLDSSVVVTGPLTDNQLRATPVPVSGTFYQVTQPVSGTFWQATQPVSIASMPSTPVTMAGGNPCQNPSATLVSITGATAGTTAVQIVALSGVTKIYVCSLTVIGVSGTTPTFSLVQGTGSNCVTGQTVLVQSWATTAATIYAFANPVAVSVAGNALCYLDTGTTPIQRYTMTYIQQ